MIANATRRSARLHGNAASGARKTTKHPAVTSNGMTTNRIGSVRRRGRYASVQYARYVLHNRWPIQNSAVSPKYSRSSGLSSGSAYPRESHRTVGASQSALSIQNPSQPGPRTQGDASRDDDGGFDFHA